MTPPQIPPNITRTGQNPAQPLQPARIQVTKVDDGFVIEGQTLDGHRKTARRVATSLDEMRTKVQDLVNQLFEPIPASEPTAPPTAQPEAASGGTAGT